MKVSHACTTLENEPKISAIQYGKTIAVNIQTNEKYSGNAIRQLGTIIQSIFLCPIRSQHSLDRLEMVR